ncbi:hypothetical protein FACS1894186_6960 [Alphaproteobacteria bacterium]|nr:hypothetical protein FACS1894186_6960 [Alphaproteobacteria bacterium]
MKASKEFSQIATKAVLCMVLGAVAALYARKYAGVADAEIGIIVWRWTLLTIATLLIGEGAQLLLYLEGCLWTLLSYAIIGGLLTHWTGLYPWLNHLGELL